MDNASEWSAAGSATSELLAQTEMIDKGAMQQIFNKEKSDEGKVVRLAAQIRRSVRFKLNLSSIFNFL